MFVLHIRGCAKSNSSTCFFQVCLVLLRRKIKALENPMFLGTTGDRTIFQIMTRHGADIGSFSVRILWPPSQHSELLQLSKIVEMWNAGV